MASITERGGRYLARVRRDGFKLVAKTFTRKSDAMAWARRVEADMEAGRWVEAVPAVPAVPTLREALAEYRATVAVKMKGAKDYVYRFDFIAATNFAAKPINDITPFDLSQWRDDLAQTRKPATVVRVLALLSGVFTWAMKERGLITSNPLALVRKPRVADGRSRTLTQEEWGWLLKEASTSKARWLAPTLTVLGRSAMRRGELFGLKRLDVDYSRAVAHLADSKNGSARDVPLCPEALVALRELDRMAEQEGRSALLPLGHVESISMTFMRTVRRARATYEQECAREGRKPSPTLLFDVRLHDLRHQAVSHWASKGALSLPELMAISGHKTPRMLTRYAHMSATALAGKLAKLAA
ncbi:tyrosine-type recombinase/integrase [Caldimonas tepidiphila]|uniref:tyrosine-type recombinase/integrase n=1 Tax=Caldimonas tepidiphila TaxID=2315841 RepID=UPI000E5AAD9F|nr:site-specific integrase [Caldimonas tepidiphila]